MQVRKVVSSCAGFAPGLAWLGVAAAAPRGETVSAPAGRYLRPSYQVGPNEITIRCPEVEEITEKPVCIDNDGNISPPPLGRCRVAGLTGAKLEEELKQRLRHFACEPLVSVAVSPYGSQPAFVVGPVQTPGTYQLRGDKNLVEVISMAGGLRADVGRWATVTRQQEWRSLFVTGARTDATGAHFVAEADVQAAMAGDPDRNIGVRPFDVVSVPKAHLVYAIGELKRQGGFALAGGQDCICPAGVVDGRGCLEHGRAETNQDLARLLRERSQSGRACGLTKVMQGRAPDPQMNSEDILMVPSNKPRNIGLRALEAVI